MIEFGWNFLYSIYFAHRTLQQCVCTILFVNIYISQLPHIHPSEWIRDSKKEIINDNSRELRREMAWQTSQTLYLSTHTTRQSELFV